MSRALIIGSGVAGTVAAIALQKAGWEPEIFEAYEHSAGLNQGVFLTLAVNGMDALRAVDAAEVVRTLGFPTGKIRFSTGAGKDLGAMPIGPVLADGTMTRTVRRADLYGALYDLARHRGIPIRHGARLQTATTSAGTVTATFADGSTADGDVLVGADGIRSTTRSLIDPTTPGPRYTGMGNVGARTRAAALDVSREAADGDYRMIWGKRCFFGYTVSPDGEIWWFANPPARTELGRNPDGSELKAQLIKQLAVDDSPAAAIVSATAGPILFSSQYGLPQVPTWQRANMVIIGDAAHAVSPATGQGASLAAEDAVVLAQCLRDSRSVSAALAAYENRRRSRVDRVAAWGAKMGSAKTVGPVARFARDLILPRILAKGATTEAMAKQNWLFSHHIDWDAADVVRADLGSD